jgi:Tfp pilus assembly protein FimT
MTLVELVLAVALLSILTSMGYPSFVYMVRYYTFRGEVSQLVFCLNQAKMVAVKLNCHVVVDMTDSKYLIFCDNSVEKGQNADWERNESERVIAHRSFDSGIRLSNNFAKNKLRFNRAITVTPGTIVITDSYGRQVKIVINTVGRIRVT